MIRDCQTRQDFARLLQHSHDRPVFLLKHSTRCPISRSAWRCYEELDDTKPDAGLWKVLVVENASLSSEIAREVGVRHESPQLLLLYKGEVLWHDSHWSLTLEAMEEALRGVRAR
jgi:bacillithiol system protein YtxJ